MATKEQSQQALSLAEAVTHLLEECRMVLPGIQALFGFQLIAVFNSRFAEDLNKPQQIIHLAAIGFVAIAVALVMTPASYHRLTGPKKVTESFLKLASNMLIWSMCFLLAGICLDFYLIAQLILDHQLISLILSIALFILSAALWFLLPRFFNSKT